MRLASARTRLYEHWRISVDCLLLLDSCKLGVLVHEVGACPSKAVMYSIAFRR